MAFIATTEIACRRESQGLKARPTLVLSALEESSYLFYSIRMRNGVIFLSVFFAFIFFFARGSAISGAFEQLQAGPDFDGTTRGADDMPPPSTPVEIQEGRRP